MLQQEDFIRNLMAIFRGVPHGVRNPPELKHLRDYGMATNIKMSRLCKEHLCTKGRNITEEEKASTLQCPSI